MKNNSFSTICKKVLKISRPRFWFYTIGPFLFGAAAVYSQTKDISFFVSAEFWIFLTIFLILGNYFIYGINDYHDFDTDQFNAKKDENTGKEYLLKVEDKAWLRISSYSILFITLLSTLILSRINIAGHKLTPTALLLWALFWFMGYAYSAPPIRFKARRFLDSLSNGYYSQPGLFIFTALTGKRVSLLTILAVVMWNAGMHFYSAIPDIEADTKAGLNTTAMYFGFKKSLVVCSLVWLSSLLLIVLSGNFQQTSLVVISVIGLIYTLLPLLSLSQKPGLDINKLYWYFPYLNTISGFVIFWTIILK